MLLFVVKKRLIRSKNSETLNDDKMNWKSISYLTKKMSRTIIYTLVSILSPNYPIKFTFFIKNISKSYTNDKIFTLYTLLIRSFTSVFRACHVK